MRVAVASLLMVLGLLTACSNSVSGANPLGCQPGCDAGLACCPWSAQVCTHDAGCAPKAGYLCTDPDPGPMCPELQFAGLGDGG